MRTTKVRVLAGRTRLPPKGNVCNMEIAEAARLVDSGLVEYASDKPPAKLKKEKRNEPVER